MAKFLRIGVHHSNVSGYTSKAWTIRRVGSTVLLKWGSVEVRGAAHGRRIYWAGRPRQKTVRYGSEKRARDYVRKAVTRRLGHQYERLLEKVRIGRRPVRHQVEPDRVLATVLFIDIVGSTEKAAVVGDRRWTEVLNHYYAAVRRELRASCGREVNTTGDGMLATFDVPAGAIRCAAAICEAVRTLGLEVRAGLHTGECEQIGNEVGGIAVHIGARVVASAGASECWCRARLKTWWSGRESNSRTAAYISSRAYPMNGACTWSKVAVSANDEYRAARDGSSVSSRRADQAEDPLRRDSVADDAVWSEPISVGEIPCYAGKQQGISVIRPTIEVIEHVKS